MKKIYPLAGLLLLCACGGGGERTFYEAPYRGPGNDYYDGNWHGHHYDHHHHGDHHEEHHGGGHQGGGSHHH